MKLAIVVLICCALIAEGQAQTSANRPGFFTRIVQAVQSFFTRGNRPNSAAAAAAAASGPLGSLTEASFSDPAIIAAIQQQQEQLQQQVQQQIQQQVPEILTRTVVETSTVYSTIPSLERLTSIETLVESTTETVTETVKVTEVMTNHVTITATDCPSASLAAFKDAAPAVISLSAKPVPSTPAVVAPTKKARLAPYVVQRAVEIEASSL